MSRRSTRLVEKANEYLEKPTNSETAKSSGTKRYGVSKGNLKSSRSQKWTRNNEIKVNEVTCPPSFEQLEGKKRKTSSKRSITRATTSKKFRSEEGINKKGSGRLRKRVYYQKVVFDGGEFEVGDDVYVRRREDASSDDEDPEVEECRVCFKSGKAIMIECDDCLGGFHLKCLKPPLKVIPEGDWICGFCEAAKMGKEVQFPKPPEGKKRVRTMREKLLAGELWAAHIERWISIYLFITF